jgi:hypothetical protein
LQLRGLRRGQAGGDAAAGLGRRSLLLHALRVIDALLLFGVLEVLAFFRDLGEDRRRAEREAGEHDASEQFFHVELLWLHDFRVTGAQDGAGR